MQLNRMGQVTIEINELKQIIKKITYGLNIWIPF